MPRTIRFHLDEQVDRAVASGLRLRGVDVTTASDAELLGASDLEHVEFAVRTNRIIITHDYDYARLAANGVEHPGFIICRQKGRQIGKMIDAVIMIWELLSPEQMRNRIEWV